MSTRAWWLNDDWTLNLKTVWHEAEQKVGATAIRSTAAERVVSTPLLAPAKYLHIATVAPANDLHNCSCRNM
jgi:hypothetical protein